MSSSAFTPAEHEAVEKALKQRLGPNFISQRPAAGGQRVVYLEGWKSTTIANEIFGFNGWSSSVTNTTIDFVDFVNGRFYVGVCAQVKVSN